MPLRAKQRSIQVRTRTKAFCALYVHLSLVQTHPGTILQVGGSTLTTVTSDTVVSRSVTREMTYDRV